MKKLFILAALLFVAGCTNADKAITILQDQGYKDIQITGYNFFACSKDDTFHTGFTATSIVTGRRVEGTVCEGLFFKGATVRF